MLRIHVRQGLGRYSKSLRIFTISACQVAVTTFYTYAGMAGAALLVLFTDKVGKLKLFLMAPAAACCTCSTPLPNSKSRAYACALSLMSHVCLCFFFSDAVVFSLLSSWENLLALSTESTLTQR